MTFYAKGLFPLDDFHDDHCRKPEMGSRENCQILAVKTNKINKITNKIWIVPPFCVFVYLLDST